MKKEILIAFLLISFTIIAGFFINYFILPRSPSIRVFGTEYSPGDEGKVFLQLLDEHSKPINNALCLISIYHPDKTEWIKNASMFYLDGSDGLYYFDFVAPNIEGVYMVACQCFYIIEEIYDYADNNVLIHGIESGSYKDTWKDDNVFHSVNEKLIAGTGNSIDFYYEFYNISLPQNYTGMSIYWIGRWDDPYESVNQYVYNFCNNSWDLLENKISTNTPSISNYIHKDEILCYISNETVKVRFNDEDSYEKTYAGKLDTDYIDIQLH